MNEAGKRLAIGRRELVKGAAASLGATALFGGGSAACSRSTAQVETTATSGTTTFRWKAQSHDPALASDYEPFLKFCATVSELSEGKLTVEPHGPGEITSIKDMLEGLKGGKLDMVVTFPGYADFISGTSFLTSYPMGLDRPDQWETWYYELGGLELARRMFAPHGVFFLAPIQHDFNLIHSRVPIRSLEDFKGLKLRMPGGLIAEVFEAAGAKTVFLTGDQVYPTLQNGTIDAADFAGPATNFSMGFANVAKYIVLGPPSTPCIHQPVDLHCALVGQKQWNALPRQLQLVLEYAARRFSWDDYTFVQKQNTLAWPKYREKGVEVIRLKDADVDKLRKVAIPRWYKWAKKDPLSREAFASQLAYMMSPAVAYLTDDMLVDADKNRLEL